MKKEIIIETKTPEEIEGELETAVSNLLRRMITVEGAEKAYISDLITDFKRQVKDRINNINN
jgi:hypothetical protein